MGTRNHETMGTETMGETMKPWGRFLRLLGNHGETMGGETMGTETMGTVLAVTLETMETMVRKPWGRFYETMGTKPWGRFLRLLEKPWG